jgi:5-methylcytosine-specific restriction endonuclease McrA
MPKTRNFAITKTRTHDYIYRQNRARALKNSDICWLCGQWIDPELTWPDPYSGSADHVIPVSRGGNNRGEVKAAHLRCNKRRGHKPAPVQHGRDW